jgi:hypothetical protein
MSSDPVITEACEYVSSVCGVSVTPSTVATELKSGVVLCQLANSLKSGAIPKVAQSNMPFKQMENIASFIAFARGFGVEDRNLFMTVDLFEAKNIKAVCTTIRELKRLSGGGFEKQTAGAPLSPAPAASASKVQIGTRDDSAVGDVVLSEEPVELKIADGNVSRTGAAHLVGHGKLDANTGVANCVQCSKPISGACINAIGRHYHPTCFTCKRCDKKISEAKFFEHEKKPYCDRCILIVVPQTNVRAKTKDAGLFAADKK